MPEETAAIALGLKVAGAANPKHLAIIRNALAKALATGLSTGGEALTDVPRVIPVHESPAATAEDMQRSVDMWIYRGVAQKVTFSSLIRPHLANGLNTRLFPRRCSLTKRCRR